VVATYIAGSVAAAPPAKGPADLIVHHAKVVSVDEKFHIYEAVAVKDGRVLALGEDEETFKLSGPKTRIIDADGHTVLPGLYDSHMHPAVTAVLTPAAAPTQKIDSIQDVLAYFRKKASATPEGDWIVLYGYPTRLAEARFPTRAELDEAAPKHPVLFQTEREACAVNTIALKNSGITRDTANPPNGAIIKDPKTGEPTGLLRNGLGLLKGLPAGPTATTSAADWQAAVRKLFALYNAQGLTSVGDRNASRELLDVYLGLRDRQELTVRVNVARSFDPRGTHEEIGRRLEELPGKDKRGGPTGAGDDWVRIGPLKVYVDGNLPNGTAYLREPWPRVEIFQISEDRYRGLLLLPPDPLRMIVEEAAKRDWQVTAHTGGDAAMDLLLDAYDQVNRQTPIKERRFCISHAHFASLENLERCQRLGVCADVQPSWLFEDGAALATVFGAKQMRWYHPYKSWLEHTTIGGGSDHIVGLDPLEATNPWSPWLGMWIALTRATERGGVLVPEERLTREQALRLYTINNAYVNREEKDKGSLEVGKLADLIIIDQDILSCPSNAIPRTKVLTTIVGGKVVYERKPD
jgi:predicted amidohydrolase YtcJ